MSIGQSEEWNASLLNDLSAVDLRRLIGSRAISPVEVMEASLERIAALNPLLVAFCDMRPDAAMAEAREAEAAVMRGDDLPPLHGLPIGIKDMNDVAGLRTTYGSLLFRDNMVHEDEFIVAHLKRQGAIVVGKTNVPELGFGATSANPLWGTTCNPHDPAFTSAGSSGGTAVALASGMVPLAMGSDFAGSLRTPASFNGITGIRPSAGTVANERRAFGFSPFNVEGPMGREARDARMLLAAMAAPLSLDPLSQRRDPGFDAPGMVDLSRLRIAVSEDLGFCPMDNGVRATFRAKMARLAKFFHAAEDVHPDLSTVDRVLAVMRSLEFVHDFKEIYDRDKASLAPNVAYEVDRAMTLGINDAAWAMGEHARIHRASQAFFQHHDLLFTPAASVAPFRHEDEWPKQINGEPMANYLRWEAIAYGVTLMGNPAVVIPCGKGPDGLPFGIQIIGPLHSDARLADIAVTLEFLFDADEALCRPRIDLARLMAAASHKNRT
jgi:Asp-tRNA(Asn)/Glu-tRNA(Gln) amidotransferase A subunit family amidase